MVGTCCFDVGSGHVQYSRGFTHILCDVYVTYNSCQCHYVQGLGPAECITNNNRAMWVCYHFVGHIFASCNEGHG
jgi:hypothetical protein